MLNAGRSQQSEAKILTEHEIREALMAFVSLNCCYGGRAAEKMAIQSIRMSNSYRYISEAVTEVREVSWKSVPHNWTMVIDGPENGVPISIWDIDAPPPEGFNFKKYQVSYEMPHTSSVSKCSKCVNTGHIPCRPCNNAGIHQCAHCQGLGTVTKHLGQGRSETRNCVWCQGRGRIPCKLCNGVGRVECGTCAGSGSVKTSQVLQISWNTETDLKIIKTQANTIPQQFLSKAIGEESVHLINGCEPNENALSQFPDSAVRTASQKAFDKYNDSSLAVHNRKVLKVRQTLITILISEVIANWKGKDELFYVIGNEKRVFFPKGYPENCCCFRLSC